MKSFLKALVKNSLNLLPLHLKQRVSNTLQQQLSASLEVKSDPILHDKEILGLFSLQGGNAPIIEIVDVGAQLLSSEDHVYAHLMRHKARVTGFEPLEEKARAREATEPLTRMLTHFIGDGTRRKFYICAFDATSSLYEPDKKLLDEFIVPPDGCVVTDVIDVHTTRLDDIKELQECDYLKLDIQGAELDALMGGRNLLDKTVVLHIEIEFVPIYSKQPLFGDIDSWLHTQGWRMIDLVKPGHCYYKGIEGVRPGRGSQLMWAEAIYIRDFEELMKLGSAKMLKAAYILHTNYGLYDLCAHLLDRHDRAFGGARLRHYLARLNAIHS
jgi:FkbM family methyltransferase